jgi:hypothetical protein
MERVGKETRSAIGSTLYGDALSTWRGREPLDRDAAPRRVDAQNRHVEELTGALHAYPAADKCGARR